MPFDFHNRDRIDHLLEEIEELRYKDRRDLSGFCFWEDDGTIGNREPQGEGLPVELGFRWKGWDRYNWLTVTAEIPDAAAITATRKASYISTERPIRLWTATTMKYFWMWKKKAIPRR